MRIFVGVVGILALFAAAYVFAAAQSAVHEIEAFIAVLIGVTGLGSAGIMERLEDVRAEAKALVAYSKLQSIDRDIDRLSNAATPPPPPPK
jgi:UDP-N-acetylmuramyl pentapeptide phosphotransferase/UDP-N-acetylglucosamine-1-phosphate transferase